MKSKIHSLEKRLNKIKEQKEPGVYFVGFENGQYIVKCQGKICYEGDKEGYEDFLKTYDNKGSVLNHREPVFIIDDIQKEPLISE